MASLHDILAYLLENYPSRSDSNARVTKMVYLSDWHHSISNGKQISPIEWVFNTYGPFVWDVKDALQASPEIFQVSEGLSPTGNKKCDVMLLSPQSNLSLTDSEKSSIDHVIKVTKELSWDDFIRLVYSTHPVVTSPRYSKLDLVSKAAEYIRR